MVWGLWQSNNSGNYNVAPWAGDEDEPVCLNDLDLCIPYSDPSEFDGGWSDLNADQMTACKNMSAAERNMLFAPIPNWTLVHHWCTTENSLNAMYNGQSFSKTGPSENDNCRGDGWKYEGYCSAGDCPIDDGGTGSSSGGADSTGTGTDGAFDCSPVDKTFVSFTTTSIDKKNNRIERDATITGDFAEIMATDPYSAMYYCGEASIAASNHRIWDMSSSSILLSLGLREDDIVVNVEGETDPLEMYDAVAFAFTYGGTFDVEIKRGNITIDYKVTVVR